MISMAKYDAGVAFAKLGRQREVFGPVLGLIRPPAAGWFEPAAA
jgi:hypothetical protein